MTPREGGDAPPPDDAGLLCPGLRVSAQWDDAASLRGEILPAERLAEHAVELARAHGASSLHNPAEPLRDRFASARERIREAYRALADEARDRRDPSPAEEWLLDNAHVVENQLREIEEDLPWGYLVELPRLSVGPMAGYPRVYGLSLDYLRHTDARVDLDTLAKYVLAYQTRKPLTIGELWAVPIMLRLGLTLTVGAIAASEVRSNDRASADAWVDRLVSTGDRPSLVTAALAELERRTEPLSPAFLVQLLRRLHEHDGPVGEALDWIQARCAEMGTSPDELSRQQHLRQAADQISVGHAITSMRAIGALDWNEFFERTSFVEEILRRDPAEVYVATDEASRDRCRHAVEDIARRSAADERRVAEITIELAEAAKRATPDDRATMHVGYYLIDAGRPTLEAAVGYRPRPREWISRLLLGRPTLFYLGSLALVTVALAGGLVAAATTSGAPAVGLVIALLALALLPASDVAIALVNGLVTALLPPRLLPKLLFPKGVPVEHRTLVVVPALLDGEDTVRRLLADLEVRSLANSDRHLHFALLTDFTDADVEERPEDRGLLELAIRGIAELNTRHGRETHRYALFHRRRLENPAQGCWMGWERKRGKLEELNRLLRGALDTSFTVVTAPPELLSSVRYVLTLDADTELPRDVARRLVATMAHPLNRPRLDPVSGRVVRGYGVIQPRVGIQPASSRQSRLARIMAGPAGLDPYTTAISDVYQDLFEEGSFVGKALYDVDAFTAALEDRVPENTLLSHDLFEGLFARAALATDIEVFDDQPASYSVLASRQHRWVRGDWQLLPWLFARVPRGGGGTRPNDLPLISRWKLLDNLRRSLVPSTLIALLVLSWFTSKPFAAAVTLAMLLSIAAPLYGRLAVSLARPSSDRAPSFVETLRGDVRTNALQVALNVAFLLDQALNLLDAIGRTLHRLFVSRRDLLEWKTTNQTERRLEGGKRAPSRRMWLGSALALLCAALVIAVAPAAAPYALPFLLLWATAPLLASWLSRPEPPRDRAAPLSVDDRLLLRDCARKTWRFFDTFVTAEDNFLPPDNFQEAPKGVVAHRTSPTNIGLYLLSTVAARDFGFITLRELAERLDATLSTIERLERREGHVLNWYDTTTLRPLDPQYVSTVDSGNLAGYLWTLRQACVELCESAVVAPASLDAALDALRLSGEPADPGRVTFERRVAEERASASADLGRATGSLRELLEVAEHLERAPRPADEGRAYWLGQAALGLSRGLEEIGTLAPWAERVLDAPEVLTTTALKAPWSGLLEDLSRARSLSSLVTATRDAVITVGVLDRALEDTTPPLPEDTKAAGMRFLAELRELLERSHDASAALLRRITEIGERATALADGMNFKLLYDEDRAVFSIGYNVSSARLDGSHYDLLASEARLASLIAVATGDAPQQHWFRMGRPRMALRSGRALLSWSGSMFEFLMPLLVTRSYEATLLDETYESVVGRQKEYGEQRGVPWGVSESAYNTMDLGMTYQYRAFGVPGLGLKAGLGDDLVIAPYATALAAMVRPDLAVENLRALAREGLDARYGYYEAIDYTPGHVPPGRRSVIVKTFMAHHQGMTLVAIDNVLHGAPMQRRFHADPRIKASELLLQERVPVGTPLVERLANDVATAPAVVVESGLVEHVGLSAEGVLRVHLLGQGELSTLVTAVGTGVTTWKGIDVHRFREDAALEAGGIFVYVRDLTDGTFWSGGYQPTCKEPTSYGAVFSIDRVEIRRRDGDLETLTEIVVSPEHPAEVRRVTVTNHGAVSRDVELTTYTEVVLAPRAADLAHRAFSGMFVETEALPERGALLARRRPRAHAEPEVWLVQVLLPDEAGWSDLEHECSRARFLGRGRSAADPAAMSGDALSGTTGMVLDPALALRRRVRLEPGMQARLSLTTALASTREAALELCAIYGARPSIARTFELGWADARVELKHLGITSVQAQRFQRLLSAMVFPDPALRFTPPPAEVRGQGKGALFARGVSGDLPILILRLDISESAELCRELLLAHEFWRVNGVSVDLVILNEEPASYLRPLQEQTLGLVRKSPAQQHLGQRGGVFVLSADTIPEDERALLLCAARVVLTASQGSLSRQLRRSMTASISLPAARAEAVSARARPTGSPALPLPELAFDNGLGGFGDDGREYVIRSGPHERSPAPWSNVIANPTFGCMLSESGSSVTWSGNSQSHRLTPWSNDPVCDPSGEVIYLRDEEDGSVWSPTPLPAGGTSHYVTRHGHGYSVFEHTRGEIDHELCVFVDERDPVKISRLRLHNRGDRARRISVYGAVEWVLGDVRERARLTVVTAWDEAAGAVFAKHPFSVFPSHRAFFTSTAPIASATADREELFGRDGSRARPPALDRVALSGRSGVGLDPCAALETRILLAPGESAEVSFILGEGKSDEHALELVKAYRDRERVASSLLAAKQGWRRLLGTVTVATPDPALDLLLNGWLLYQALSSRFWARSAFYQSGGAYGFRDQLQDVLAFLFARPELAREHLLRAAARQFTEGDVQHWWHPETGAGVRTRCSDDMLWLPYVTAEYVRATGDQAVLDDLVPFLEQRPLEPGEHDLFAAPEVSRASASLYEHCARALDFGATVGAHGLPLMGGGDWNDGMSRVGVEGKGESVWLGWFLAKTLGDFAPLAASRGDTAREQRCRAEASRLARALDEHGWDGEWYRRASFDDGTWLGSKQSPECTIDSIAQSWAVLAGVGDPTRAARAVDAAERLLLREREGMMLLFTPPFERAGHDPGYIRAYPAGVRENGGQYTHGALWSAMARAKLGDGDRAAEILGLLNPIHHASTPEACARYAVEPYVIAADVYAAEGHVGRGGWTWYTGSASWMYRIALESILGVRLEGGQLTITPCVPRAWRRYEITYQRGESRYHVVVENPLGLSSGVWRTELDGKVVRDGKIPLDDDGRVHEVRVVQSPAAAVAAKGDEGRRQAV